MALQCAKYQKVTELHEFAQMINTKKFSRPKFKAHMIQKQIYELENNIFNLQQPW